MVTLREKLNKTIQIYDDVLGAERKAAAIDNYNGDNSYETKVKLLA